MRCSTGLTQFVRDVRKHGGWAKASRASSYYTAEDLDAFFDEYSELLPLHPIGRQARGCGSDTRCQGFTWVGSWPARCGDVPVLAGAALVEVRR